jgi:hypothetical protein
MALNEGTVTTKPNQWWRWPMIPLASVTGAVVGTVAITAFQWLGMKIQGGFSEDGWWYRFILPVISSATFGYIYAAIACYVAPKGKVIAGTVMTTVLGLVLLLGLVLAWASSKYSFWESMQTTIGSVAMLIAGIVAVMQVHQERHTN